MVPDSHYFLFFSTEGSSISLDPHNLQASHAKFISASQANKEKR